MASIEKNTNINRVVDRNRNMLSQMYEAEVVDNTDSIFTGRLTVRIPDLGSLDGTVTAILITPFGGYTSLSPEDMSADTNAYGEDGTSENGTPKAFGMWTQPPTIGSKVLVGFTEGKTQCFVIGSMVARDMNHTMGGRASSEAKDGKIHPVGEKNPKDTTEDSVRPIDTKADEWLKTQKLQDDYARGHSMSSARRESPSRVFGITTLDGHVFTLDDGDKDGDSNNIRLRSRKGAQILIDDTNEMIFITNHAGSAWVEMDKSGNIDVYSKTSVNVHAEEDLNFHAGGNINFEAAKGINMKADSMHVETINDYHLKSGNDVIVQALNDLHNKTGGNHIETSSMVYMNSSVSAKDATVPKVNQLDTNEKITASVSARVPEHHPWKGATTIQETITKAQGRT